jgi:hypothetical protein
MSTTGGEDTEGDEDGEGNRGKRRRSSRFPIGVVDILQAWLVQHLSNPYPSPEQAQQLAQDTGLTLSQIEKWFANARSRRVPAIRDLLSRAGHATDASPGEVNHGSDIPSQGPVNSVALKRTQGVVPFLAVQMSGNLPGFSGNTKPPQRKGDGYLVQYVYLQGSDQVFAVDRSIPLPDVSNLLSKEVDRSLGCVGAAYYRAGAAMSLVKLDVQRQINMGRTYTEAVETALLKHAVFAPPEDW